MTRPPTGRTIGASRSWTCTRVPIARKAVINSYRVSLLIVLGALALSFQAASTVGIDGRVDAEYGPAVCTQITQTGFADNPSGYPGSVTDAKGSELGTAQGAVPLSAETVRQEDRKR